MANKSLTAGEVAKQAQVDTDIVRYYARIGLLKPVKNLKNGYKLYDSHDVSRIGFIRKSKNLGYTLKEIKEIISHADSGASPCPIVRQIIEKRIDENRRMLDEMLSLQCRMETAIEKWKTMPDGMPDGHSVCVLIESFMENEV